MSAPKGGPDDAPEEGREGFLSRWSRRKRAGGEPEPTPAEDAAAPDADPPSAAPARAACPIPNMPEIDLSALPRIEELTAESDFSLFLRPGVPGTLRNAALRRMWTLDPGIRDYIGPVDYQWDFNTPGGLPFGFSAELGGDVAKLLAQAIGKVEEIAARLEPEPPAEVEEPPVPILQESVSLPVAEPAPALPEPATVAVPPEPQTTRRRHGSALPA
jgi:hypothetical protein